MSRPTGTPATAPLVLQPYQINALRQLLQETVDRLDKLTPREEPTDSLCGLLEGWIWWFEE